MNGPTMTSEMPSIPPLKPRRPSQVSNYSYPRPESPFFFIPQYEVRRGSAGSDDSMPGMIEDQGSDVSTEDDYQTQGIGGADLWDSFWQARVHEELGGGRQQYPALVETPVLPLSSQEGQRDRAGSQISQRDSTWPLPLTTTSPTKRQTKAPPRASYSLFPPKNDSPPTTPPRRSSLPKEESIETDSRSPSTPTKPRKVNKPATAIKATDITQAPRPAPRRPLPATPRPQGPRTTSILTVSTLHTKPLPKTPDEKRRSARRVTGVNHHKRSISKTPTQSLPLLSATVQRKTIRTVTPPYKHQYSQSQTFHVSRPVPPAPATQNQNVSVFEFSDDEDEDDATVNGDEIRGLALRLVRGLTQHRDRNGHTGARAQTQVQAQARLQHQRSVSDSPSTPTPTPFITGGSRPPHRDRAVTTGTVELVMRPGTSAGILGGSGSDGTGTRRQSNLRESRSRPWLSRQGSELFFGRFLGRRCS